MNSSSPPESTTPGNPGELSILLVEREREIRVLQNKLDAFQVRIEELEASTASYEFRLARLLGRIRRRMAPPGSRRAAALRHLVYRADVLWRMGMSRRKDGSQLPSPGPIDGGLADSFSANYQHWQQVTEPSEVELDRQRSSEISIAGPQISILLPVYVVPPEILQRTLESVIQQTYRRWELCIAYADPNDENWNLIQSFQRHDDRIKTQKVPENKGISANTNICFSLATGEYIALLDHDDELAPWALFDMAQAIQNDPSVDFIYSDKDCIDEKGQVRLNPLVKPSWSPEVLYSVNYLTHFNVIRKSLVESVGGWRSETDGAQDWDLFFRVTERTNSILRVTGVHYHWKLLQSSTSLGLAAKPYALAAQLKSQRDHVTRLGIQAEVIPSLLSGFRIIWNAPLEPQATLIIYSADDESVTRLLSPLAPEAPRWLSHVIVVSDETLSGQPDMFAGIHVTYLRSSKAGFSELQEEIAAIVGTRPVAILDGRSTRLSKGWLREVIGWVSGHPGIGFAGSICLDGEDRVIEAGRVVDPQSGSAPLFRNSGLEQWGPFGGPLWYRNTSGVGPDGVAFRSFARLQESGETWDWFVAAQCAAVLSRGERGLVCPHARVHRYRRPNEVTAMDLAGFGSDPYFHPMLASVSPARFRIPA